MRKSEKCTKMEALKYVVNHVRDRRSESFKLRTNYFPMGVLCLLVHLVESDEELHGIRELDKLLKSASF